LAENVAVPTSVTVHHATATAIVHATKIHAHVMEIVMAMVVVMMFAIVRHALATAIALAIMTHAHAMVIAVAVVAVAVVAVVMAVKHAFHGSATRSYVFNHSMPRQLIVIQQWEVSMTRNKTFIRRRIAWAIMVAVIALSHVDAQTVGCSTPNDSKRSQVTDYVIARYKIASKADLVLVENKQANDACFWSFKYKLTSPQREIALYLSPDGSYLTPTLYDMRIDPLVEEAANRERISKSLTAGSSPSLGPQNSIVTIVEFSDFQCPYCKRMADMLTKSRLTGSTTQPRIIFKFFPLPMHPWAADAAKMAECVSLQKPDEFWKVHDYIFGNQQQLNVGNVKERVSAFVAANVKIDQTQYQTCIDNDLALGPITKDVNLGKSLSVSGTPTLFINGALYRGIMDATQLQNIIEEASKTSSRPLSGTPGGFVHTSSLDSSTSSNGGVHSRTVNECPNKESLQ
jgi:protein-disulfide isomerase